MSLHLDGFDQFALDPGPALALARAGYTTAGAGPVVTPGRVGGSSLSVTNGQIRRVHPWITGSFVVGCACRYTGRGSIAWLEFPGGERLVLWVSPDDGQPRLNADMTGSLPVLNVWYYFEVVLSRGGAASLYVNNRLDGTTTLTPAMNAANEVTVCFGTLPPADYRPGVTIGDGSAKTYDDIAIRDGARLGPIAIRTRFPNSTDSSDWTMLGGASEHAIVSTLPPEPLDTFIAADTVDDTVQFRSNAALPNDNPIIATGIVTLVRKAPNLDARLRGYIGGEPGAAYRDAVIDVGPTWEMKYITFDTVAGDTKEGIEGAPFGLQVAAP